MNRSQIKLAFKFGYEQGLKKQGSPISDSALMYLTGAVPYLGSHPAMIGGLTGLMSNPATDKDVDEYDEHPGRAFIPGVSHHRMERRMKKSLTDSSGNARHNISQQIGHITSGLAGAGVGAILGALASKNDRGKGAVIGGVAGGVAPSILAAIAALATKRRDKEQHNKYIESSTVPEYFVPGLGLYNRFKTIGHEQGNFNERRKKREVEALAALLAAQKAEDKGENK